VARPIRSALVVLLVSAGTAVAADPAAPDPTPVNVPAGVTYKPASAEVNAKATELVKRTLVANATDDQVMSLFGGKALICGPGLWLDVHADPALAKLDGGDVRIIVPITPSDGSPPHDQTLHGKLFQSRADVLAFWHALVARSDLTAVTVRKLTADELKLYWAMISFDITEPVFVAEFGGRRLLLQSSSPDDLRVTWVDDLAQYHGEPKPTTKPVATTRN
jgi:hypothetical protein